MAASALPKTPLTTLEFVRRTAGMSRPDLAERSGVSVATILASERFGRVPHLATARRLAHPLNLALDELFPKENTMSEDRPITPEQALLAVKAAGLDPDRSLSDQLHDDGDGALEQQLADLSEQLRTLSAALGEAGHHGSVGQPTDPQAHERRFAERYRDALNGSLTPWMGEHDDAA